MSTGHPTTPTPGHPLVAASRTPGASGPAHLVTVTQTLAASGSSHTFPQLPLLSSLLLLSPSSPLCLPQLGLLRPRLEVQAGVPRNPLSITVGGCLAWAK